MTRIYKLISLLVLICISCNTLSACDTNKTKNGGKVMKEYNTYINSLSKFPASFEYDGKEYKGFGSEFVEKNRTVNTTEDKTSTIIILEHKKSGALFTLDTAVYPEYSAYEWVISITNNGAENTKSFSFVNGADISFKGKKPVLKGINGDLGDMYAPYEVKMDNNTVSKESTSGRPTHGNFPYFNLEYGDGGTFIALGWPGCWKASFTNKGNETRFTGGQYELDTYLKPGETIRTPLFVFVKYEGRNEAKAMNVWRKWYINCNLRKVNSSPFQPVFAASTMSQGMNTNSVKRIAQSYLNHGVQLDYLWMDAGWYTNASGGTASWPETGSLNVDVSRFPDRFSEISKLMNDNGGKVMLWFEPEVIRLPKDEFLKYNTDFKVDWMLGTAAPGSWLEGQLTDLGNEECRNWLIGRISKVIDDGGISMYRQDFNVDPAPVWKSNDDYDRLGYTENNYVQGYLTFFDSLIKKYPNMLIDSCASGGGRNDIETMRRAVPLHISDFWDGNDGGINERQATMQSLIQWIPYIKLEKNTGIETSLYTLRSCYAPWINANMPVMSKDSPWDLMLQVRNEWEQIKKFFYSDYYQLTEWSKSDEKWRGWEFFDSKMNAGYAQLFRPASSEENQKLIKFYGLNKNHEYQLKDFDGILDIYAKGSELMDKGITITLPDKASSIVIMITKK